MKQNNVGIVGFDNILVCCDQKAILRSEGNRAYTNYTEGAERKRYKYDACKRYYLFRYAPQAIMSLLFLQEL